MEDRKPIKASKLKLGEVVFDTPGSLGIQLEFVEFDGNKCFFKAVKETDEYISENGIISFFGDSTMYLP